MFGSHGYLARLTALCMELPDSTRGICPVCSAPLRCPALDPECPEEHGTEPWDVLPVGGEA